MEIVKYLYGGAAFRAKYQIGATVADVGVPLLTATADGDSGLIACTTTGASNMVGINLDTATYVTAQQTDGSTAERTVTMDIRPDAVIKAVLSGATTEDTALGQRTITTATTDGLDVTTTGDTWQDEGLVWGYTGANAGQQRKVTSVSSSVATVDVAFENDHQVGDIFLHAPFFPMDAQSETVTLSALFTQIDASASIITNGAEFNIIDVVTFGAADDGLTKSYALLVSDDHALNKLA